MIIRLLARSGVIIRLLARLLDHPSRRTVPGMPSRREAEEYMARNAEKWRRPLVPPLREWDIR